MGRMMTVGDSLRDWTGMDRPLRGLSKEQLWKYPLADPSKDAEWAFSREVIARMAAYRAHEEKVEKALQDVEGNRRALSAAKANLARAQDKQAEAELRGQGEEHREVLAKLQRAVEGAEAAIKRSEARAQQLAADLKTDSKRDDLIHPQESRSYYAKRYAGEWNRIMQDWRDETLLAAQTYGWASFLGAARSVVIEDLRKFEHVEGIANLVGQEKGPTFLAIKAMWDVRISPPTADRREFLSDNEAGGTVVLASLKPEQQKKYWRWWRHYNSMTLRYQWKDDTGVAYDDRQFNPNKLNPEEQDGD